MKLTTIVLATLAAASPALAEEGGLILCQKLGELVPSVTSHRIPVDCTCDGPDFIEVGPVRLGGPAGGNGNLNIDCYFSTEITPAHYQLGGEGPVNLRSIESPVRVVLRRCDTSDCYWFFGSASCVIETTIDAGHVQTYRVEGSCERVVTA